ncbi:MAG: tryptophan 7-halogenase [Myxococcota bacterium]
MNPSSLSRIAIIGNGIMANIAALYLRRQLPRDVEILVIGPPTRGGMPVVGESTIEITAQFLENKLGLGSYLREHHYPKYALTYYFKLNPEDPADRRYSVHCNEREPDDFPRLEGGWEGPMARPPSWQLNREVFDRDMCERVDRTDGIERIYGKVRHVELGRDRSHTLTIERTDGQEHEVSGDWVIDASGRRSVLGRQLGLKVRSEIQRDAFWFRVSDFDPDLLSRCEALGPRPAGPGEAYHYDRYYSTHHFMGRGHWIWMIPLRSKEPGELMSIGLSMRSDLYRGHVRNIDDFMEQVGAVHPLITDLVGSGRVLDSNVYRRYHYYSKQAYSADRWAVIGDAAYALDPLLSNGLTFGVIQLEQLGEMIARDACSEHDPDYIERLERALWAPMLSSQRAIGDWYETMHDPFLSALRLSWIEVAYFYLLLPLVINRAHCDPNMMPAWSVLMLREGEEGSGFDIPRPLAEARKLFDQVRPEHFIYRGKIKVNPMAMTQVEDVEGLYRQFRMGAQLRRNYMADAIARVKLAEGLPVNRTPEICL